MSAKHTPGPWLYENGHGVIASGNPLKVAGRTKVALANRALIAAAPTMLDEMARYLPLIEWLERNPAMWESATLGTGIATANGYRRAIAKAEGRS